MSLPDSPKPSREALLARIAELEAQLQLAREHDDRLKRMEKLESLSVFAGAIAHNFNNLLMSVLGNLELAEMEMERGSEEESMIRDARTAGRRAADLARQMLVYVGQGQGSQVDVDLATLLEETVEGIEHRPSNPIPIHLHIAEAPLNFSGDPLQVRQVFMNIIQNASEACGESQPAVEVRAGRGVFSEEELARSYLRPEIGTGRYVWFEVADHGPGMDEETLGKIFDPFFSTKFTGRGLGLATVLGTVRGHNGTIIVESAPEKGTVFRVLFPELRPAPQDATQADAQSPGNQWLGHDRTILLIEDEVEVARVCQRMLKRIGFLVDHAPDGETGIHLFTLDPRRYCCILLDLILPGIDGEEVLHRIRAQSHAVPVILSSGYSPEEINRRFAGKQLEGIIHKPFEYGVLLSEFRRVLGG